MSEDDMKPSGRVMSEVEFIEWLDAVSDALSQLDGSEESRISLITGLTRDEIADLGGVGRTERRPAIENAGGVDPSATPDASGRERGES